MEKGGATTGKACPSSCSVFFSTPPAPLPPPPLPQIVMKERHGVITEIVEEEGKTPVREREREREGGGAQRASGRERSAGMLTAPSPPPPFS